MEEGKQENLEKSPPIKRERGTPNKLYLIAQSTSQISVFFVISLNLFCSRKRSQRSRRVKVFPLLLQRVPRLPDIEIASQLRYQCKTYIDLF